jgi:uncharacterized protein (DUF362 family)
LAANPEKPVPVENKTDDRFLGAPIMEKFKVSLVRYDTPLESVRKAVDQCDGLQNLSPSAKVFIKPNIVFWTKAVAFPKWGVITTSRVVEDMVILLKERGIDDITLGEGPVLYDPKDAETPQHAFESLGYNVLKKRYGLKALNIFERPFEKVDFGEDVTLQMNADILHSDFVVNLPVLKTHAQTLVSLGIKNFKGMLNNPSRKKCHSADPVRDLNFMVSKLADRMPPSFTLIDGIYTNERGPAMDGKARRSDILVASCDVFSADKVGALTLGFEPSQVPHLVHAGRTRGRPLDLSDVDVVGEKIEDMASPHQYTFPYTEDGSLPVPMAKMGVKGLSYPKFDLSLCTYCSAITGAVLSSIAFAWKGEPWDDVEVLTGKIMKPTPGKKTVLIGQCLYKANKDHPNFENMISVKTCPPSPDAIIDALHQVGIDVNPSILQNLDQAPAFFMQKYQGKPEFEESFFRIEE